MKSGQMNRVSTRKLKDIAYKFLNKELDFLSLQEALSWHEIRQEKTRNKKKLACSES